MGKLDPNFEPARTKILENVKVHNRIFMQYEEKHGEIFNVIEQKRLLQTIGRAASLLKLEGAHPKALDFGCGSGNLTRHLLDIGFDVVASDVSENFLEVVRHKFHGNHVVTHRLNGENLIEFSNDTFDLIATYSVLHHVPDYISAVLEMARVCKPGGLIYLDHEPSVMYWTDSQKFSIYKSQVSRFNWKKFFVWSNYLGKIRRLFFDPKYANEGDIHVWPDDHIEWDLVEKCLLNTGCEVVFSEDYLLFREGYYRDVYDSFKGSLADMRVMVFRKL